MVVDDNSIHIEYCTFNHFRILAEEFKLVLLYSDKGTMIKLTLTFLIMTFATVTFAVDCFPLYQKVADQIQDKGKHDTYVGGQIYVNNGQLGYWPGIKVSGHVDNWSQELIDAIKWGPFTWSASSEDPRKEWLETFRNSIKDECKLPKDNYDKLRAMLKELMEDGSFCPGDQTLAPKFIGGKSEFKKILKEAVKDQRFSQYCQDKAVADDSHRAVKEFDSKVKATKTSGSSASEQ